MDIPEYYRQFQTPKTKKPEEEKKTETQPQEKVTQKIQPKQETKKLFTHLRQKIKLYSSRWNGFRLNQL